MKFVKGHKGCGGRPKGSKTTLGLAEYVRQRVSKDWLVSEVEKIATQSTRDDVKLRAIEFLRDTGWGKPPQGVYQSDVDGNAVPFNLVLRTVTGPDDPSVATVAANHV